MLGRAYDRKKAQIDRDASPDELDTAMRIITPYGWVWLFALGLGIFVVTAWSLFGDLPVKVAGNGMLMRDDVRSVRAEVAGIINEIKVKAGDPVQAADGDDEGFVVAVMELTEAEKSDLKIELKAAEKRLSDLIAQRETRAPDLRRLVENDKRQLGRLRQELNKKKDLRARGLARDRDVLNIDSEISRINAQIYQNEREIGDMDLSISGENTNIRKLKEQINEQSELKSPIDGVVSSVLVSEGDLVKAGDRIVNLEAPEEEDIRVLLFVPFAEGKKILPGFDVQISPTTLPPEEYGYILGKVVSVSSMPATQEEVRSTLSDDRLAGKFVEDTPFSVNIKPLTVDTPLGGAVRFKWTSSKGEAIQIDSNTPCTAQIITERRPPISLVIPKMKKMLGMS